VPPVCELETATGDPSDRSRGETNRVAYAPSSFDKLERFVSEA